MAARTVFIALAGVAVGVTAALVIPRLAGDVPNQARVECADRSVQGATTPALSTTESRRQEAWRATVALVRDQLKSPATAQFPDLPARNPDSAFDLRAAFNDMNDPNRVSVFEYTSSAGPEHQEWSVEGWVDAQDGFGALLRQRFTAMVQADGSPQRWKLQSLVFTPR